MPTESQRRGSDDRKRLEPVGGAPSLLALAVAPLVQRFRRGEGALLAVSFAWIGWAWPGVPTALLQAGIATLVLMAAYGLNDWHDARGDLADPKKDRRLVQGYLDRRSAFAAGLLIAHVGLVGVSSFALGPAAGLATAAMLGVNAAYSYLLKGVPLADLAVVGVWGGAFVAIVGAPPGFSVTVGLMTSIMHLFQIEQDRVVDAENDIHTTAVELPSAASGLLVVICAGLGAALWPSLGVGAAAVLVPLAVYHGIPDTQRAWMACRIWCGAVLLALLGTL